MLEIATPVCALVRNDNKMETMLLLCWRLPRRCAPRNDKEIIHYSLSIIHQKERAE